MLVLGLAVACGDAGSAPVAEDAAPPVTNAPNDGGGADGARDALPPEPVEPLCLLAGPPASTPDDVLVFSEEFEGSGVDLAAWNVLSGYKGHGTIENTASPANAVVSDGALHVVTERNPTDVDHPYVSGHIDTLNKFARTYGKIEFRARFPFAEGVWYALWGRPWTQSFPELDIEIVNRSKKTKSELYFVNHWDAPPLPADDRRAFAMTTEPDVTTFHTYTVLWKPGSLEWQLDGVTMLQAPAKGVPDLPVYWIVNAWVGGWVGTPTATTPFPNTFDLDYLRVYRVGGLVADPVIKIANSRTSYKRSETITIAAANFDEACAHVEMYDGDTLVRTTSTVPFRFPLARLAAGAHTLTFVATDGVRRTTQKLVTQVN